MDASPGVAAPVPAAGDARATGLDHRETLREIEQLRRRQQRGLLGVTLRSYDAVHDVVRREVIAPE